jgi:hypothetical protein
MLVAEAHLNDQALGGFNRNLNLMLQDIRSHGQVNAYPPLSQVEPAG